MIRFHLSKNDNIAASSVDGEEDRDNMENKRPPISTSHPMNKNKKHRSSSMDEKEGINEQENDGVLHPLKTTLMEVDDNMNASSGNNVFGQMKPSSGQPPANNDEVTAEGRLASDDPNNHSNNDANNHDSELDMNWNHLIESGAGSEEVPNLSMYLAAKSCRETAKDLFSVSLDECIAGLNDGVNEMLQELVVPIHEEQGQRFEAYEDDIIATMKSNHDRRKSFQNSLQCVDKEWKKRYQKLLRTLLQQQTEEGNSMETSENCARDKNSNAQEQGGEPDWDELAQYEPARENIRSFLDAREHLQATAEQLSQNLDEIHAGLKEEVDSIIQIAADLHNQHETDCIPLEDDIQFHIMNNHKRRNDLTDRLEESAKQSQGLISKLLARLSGSR